MIKASPILRTILDGMTHHSRQLHEYLPPERDVLSLIDHSVTLLMEEPTVLALSGEFRVVGDVHGDIDTLVQIFGRTGYPPESRYLFLGDYVDRGENSLAVLIFLLALTALEPDKVYLLRGNHEQKSVCSKYGFKAECKICYSKAVFAGFCKLFRALSIAAVLNGKVFCVHGGISVDAQSMLDISSIQKPISGTNETVADLLWSDPRDELCGAEESDRGCGHFFGEDALDEFLDVIGCECMIRGHECCQDGVARPFDNEKCVTVFSTVDYCQQGNTAAVLTVTDKVEWTDVLLPLDEEQQKHRRIPLPSWLLGITSMKSVDDILQLGMTDWESPL